MRDGVFSYVHLDNANKVLYMERWREEPIPFDDIETQTLIEATSNQYPQLFLDEEEDDDVMYQPTPIFGSKVLKNRHLKEKIWSDLRLQETFIEPSPSTTSRIKDKTMVPPIAYAEDIASDLSLADFLSNGYNLLPAVHINESSPGNLSDSIMGFHHGDITGNSTSDLMGSSNNTFLNMRSSSINNPTLGDQSHPQQQQQQQPLETPRSGRVRQLSDKNFQTPISRIVR
ncbi:CTA6 [[Candida] subhashii]|uniref:CTA6 n=1 Tax=[Candida] subhashii TaxID=561895 RepID=A0A8J5UJL2_9ASCO|nr:CTA6 [[Candida] subhashii]KAG7661787.1 CTA6 [[Candida] subhashii]